MHRERRERSCAHKCAHIHTETTTIPASCTVCACIAVFSFEDTVFTRRCVLFSTCVCLHVCTKKDWRLTGSQGKAWNLWPEYIFSHISDEWGSPSHTWQSQFPACLKVINTLLYKETRPGNGIIWSRQKTLSLTFIVIHLKGLFTASVL